MISSTRPTPTTSYRQRKKGEEDAHWRRDTAHRIAAKHMALSIRSVFDYDDIYGIALAALERLSGEDRAYQYRSAVNTVINAKCCIAGEKGQKVVFPIFLDIELPSDKGDPEKLLVDEADMGPYLISQVPDPQERKVLQLIFLDGVEFTRSGIEAQEHFGCSVASVTRLKQRALQSVRKVIEAERK